MIIPYDQLQPDTLNALLEEFVTRDGAIHGHADVLLQTQIQAVKRQLDSGKAVIVFDTATESCSIRLKDGLAEEVEGEMVEREYVDEEAQPEYE